MKEERTSTVEERAVFDRACRAACHLSLSDCRRIWGGEILLHHPPSAHETAEAFQRIVARASLCELRDVTRYAGDFYRVYTETADRLAREIAKLAEGLEE